MRVEIQRTIKHSGVSNIQEKKFVLEKRATDAYKQLKVCKQRLETKVDVRR